MLLNGIARVCRTLFNHFRKSGRATSGPLFLKELLPEGRAVQLVSSMVACNSLLPSPAAPYCAAATRIAGGHHPNNTICRKRFLQRVPFSSAQSQKRACGHCKLSAVVRLVIIDTLQQRVMLLSSIHRTFTM